jgi:hypothetical protein
MATGSGAKTGPPIQRRNPARRTVLTSRLLASQPTAECGYLAALQGEMVLEQDRIGFNGRHGEMVKSGDQVVGRTGLEPVTYCL